MKGTDQIEAPLDKAPYEDPSPGNGDGGPPFNSANPLDNDYSFNNGLFLHIDGAECFPEEIYITLRTTRISRIIKHLQALQDLWNQD